MRIPAAICFSLLAWSSCSSTGSTGRPPKDSPDKVEVNPDAGATLNIVVPARCYFLTLIPGTRDLTLELREVVFPRDIAATVEMTVSGGADSAFREKKNLEPKKNLAMILPNAAGQSYFEVDIRGRTTSGGSVTGFVNHFCRK